MPTRRARRRGKEARMEGSMGRSFTPAIFHASPP